MTAKYGQPLLVAVTGQQLFKHLPFLSNHCKRNVSSKGTEEGRFPRGPSDTTILNTSLFRCVSSGQTSWLKTQMFRDRFPEIPHFLGSSGSGTGSTQPREDK
jgi:hypothetical protein